jgi:hypothetical protein
MTTVTRPAADTAFAVQFAPQCYWHWRNCAQKGSLRKRGVRKGGRSYKLQKQPLHLCQNFNLHTVNVQWSCKTPWMGEELQLLLFLNLDTRWGWVVSITPRPRFTPGVRAPRTHCTGGWVGPRAGLDAEGRGKEAFCPCRESNPGNPARSQILYWVR